MKIDYYFEQLEEKIKQSKIEIKNTESLLKKSKLEMKKFFLSCEQHGIKRVSIQESDDKIQSSKRFCFGVMGSVFADEESKKTGYPAIWSVCEDVKISSGCGNTGQHQISIEAQNNLIDGTYFFKNGCWFKQK